jgi:hypothetical protein
MKPRNGEKNGENVSAAYLKAVSEREALAPLCDGCGAAPAVFLVRLAEHARALCGACTRAGVEAGLVPIPAARRAAMAHELQRKAGKVTPP